MSKPEHAGYELSESPIFKDLRITRYATDDPTVYVEFYPTLMGQTEIVLVNPDADANDEPFGDATEELPAFAAYLKTYDRIREKLLNENVEFLSPEVIDSDVADCWAVFAIPDGFYTLREALKSFPDGKMDARDVAWMVKRFLILLKVTESSPYPTLDNFLVSPEGHSIVLIGNYDHFIPNRVAHPLLHLADLMTILINQADQNAVKQIDFIKKAANSLIKSQNSSLKTGRSLDFGYADVLREFSIKLEDVYGPPRYHHLELDPNLSKEFPGI